MDWLKGLTQNMSFTLFGTSTQKEDNAFTYSPATSNVSNLSTQTTTTTSETSTLLYAPKKTTYYAPVMIYSSPFASASPSYKEGYTLSPTTSTSPAINPQIIPYTSTNQAQTSSKTDQTNDETMKWILIGGALILGYLYLRG